MRVETQRFDIPRQEPPREGLNVIGWLDGPDGSKERPATLLGAHYDTVPGSPGADDDASGVAVALECARVLAALPRPPQLAVALFDAEERQPPAQGLHGSTAFARKLRADGTRLSGAFILEMVGCSAAGQRIPAGMQLLFPRAFDILRRGGYAGDSLVAITDAKSRWMGRGLERSAAVHGGGLKMLPMELPGWMPTPLNLRRSDHYPFWQAGYPAVMIGDTANFRNPHYHRPSDTPETLNYGLMTRAARALTALIASDMIA
jgi:Zn-dependent M28 family amino/carboxypeptidase